MMSRTDAQPAMPWVARGTLVATDARTMTRARPCALCSWAILAGQRAATLLDGRMAHPCHAP